MKPPNFPRGHFRSLWQKTGDVLIPTTVTNQVKSRVRERELAKRQLMADEIEKLVGCRPAMIARSIDGVNRRWVGVKAHSSD